MCAVEVKSPEAHFILVMSTHDTNYFVVCILNMENIVNSIRYMV